MCPLLVRKIAFLKATINFKKCWDLGFNYRSEKKNPLEVPHPKTLFAGYSGRVFIKNLLLEIRQVRFFFF